MLNFWPRKKGGLRGGTTTTKREKERSNGESLTQKPEVTVTEDLGGRGTKDLLGWVSEENNGSGSKQC